MFIGVVHLRGLLFSVSAGNIGPDFNLYAVGYIARVLFLGEMGNARDPHWAKKEEVSE